VTVTLFSASEPELTELKITDFSAVEENVRLSEILTNMHTLSQRFM